MSNQYLTLEQKKHQLNHLKTQLSFKESQVASYIGAIESDKAKLVRLNDLLEFSKTLPDVNSKALALVNNAIPEEYKSRLSIVYAKVTVAGQDVNVLIDNTKKNIESSTKYLIEYKAEYKLALNNYESLNNELNELYA